MAIARVQSKVANTAATNGTSLNLVFDATPLAGNYLVIGVAGITSAIGVIRPTDQAGITWSSYIQAAAPAMALIFGRVSSGIASATVVINSGTSGPIAVVGAEYSGVNLRPDKQIQASSTSASPASGATATTSTASELWIGVVSARGTNANTMSAATNSFTFVIDSGNGNTTGQTNTTNGTSNTDVTCGLLQRIVSSTGTANAGCTITSNLWRVLTMTFDETPTSGGGAYTFA